MCSRVSRNKFDGTPARVDWLNTAFAKWNDVLSIRVVQMIRFQVESGDWNVARVFYILIGLCDVL